MKNKEEKWLGYPLWSRGIMKYATDCQLTIKTQEFRRLTLVIPYGVNFDPHPYVNHFTKWDCAIRYVTQQCIDHSRVMINIEKTYTFTN